jgi:hypothetical protein
MDMWHGHEAWICRKDVKHGQHEYAARTCGIDMDMQRGHMYRMAMQSGQEAWTCSMDLTQDMQHGHKAQKFGMDM